MTDERSQASILDSSRKFPKVLRLVYLIVILLLTAVTSMFHDKNEIAMIVAHVQNALNLVDPFYVVNHLYLFGAGSIPPDLQLGPGPRTLIDAIWDAGWLTISFICASTAILYYLSSHPKGDGNLLWSFIFSFVAAYPLKWILIGLVAALGSVVGFIAWIDAIVITVMEVFLHAHQIYKAGAEVKEAASEIRES